MEYNFVIFFKTHYLYQYEKYDIPFGVIHLSDEWLGDDIHYYNFKNCKFVFRNWYHESKKHEKVVFFPLGYKPEFWKKERDGIFLIWDRRKYDFGKFFTNLNTTTR